MKNFSALCSISILCEKSAPYLILEHAFIVEKLRENLIKDILFPRINNQKISDILDEL